MSRFVRVLAVLICLALAAPLLFADPDPDQQYSDKDKKMMAEIAQRPEVQARIQAEYDKLRRADLEFAYTVNTSSRYMRLSARDESDFRAQYGELYDNPILVQYVNSVGQRLVPKNSPNLYSFKLLLDPVPRAEALSTGTIYISTGLVSLLDNEAQLSYILGHEIAHVERNHFYARIRNSILEEELGKQKQADAEKHKAIFGLVGAAAGAAIGGAAGGGSWAMYGAMIGGSAAYATSQLIFRNKFEPTDWSKQFEDEADEAGVQYMLQQNYDAREIPRLYARLDNMVSRDSRVGLGFIGSPQRTKERAAHIQRLLTGAYAAEIQTKMSNPGLVGSSPEFSLLMAALKRDNGIVALDYDLFAMAKDNLQDAANLRSDDPRVHYYLGLVDAQTGRTAEDRQAAIGEFMKAIQYDAERGAYPDAHLEHALYLITQNDPTIKDDILKELKTYVALYQRDHGGALPRNMPIIYDYFSLAGDSSWFVPPVNIISTKNVDALYVVPVGGAPNTATTDVVGRATGVIQEQPVPVKTLPVDFPKAGKVTPARESEGALPLPRSTTRRPH